MVACSIAKPRFACREFSFVAESTKAVEILLGEHREAEDFVAACAFERRQKPELVEILRSRRVNQLPRQALGVVETRFDRQNAIAKLAQRSRNRHAGQAATRNDDVI